MKLFSILALAMFSSATFAAQLTETKLPSGVKVRAAASAWEKIYTPNECYPDAITFSVTKADSEGWNTVIEQAAKKASSDVKKVTRLEKLASEEAVRKAATQALDAQGMSEDAAFNDKLFRVFEKVKFRFVYEGDTTDGDTKSELEGHFLAIVDTETNELVLLTHGDAFRPSRCGEE